MSFYTFQEFMNNPFIDSWIYADLWTFVHFFSGFVLMVILVKRMKNRESIDYFTLLLFLLGSWEVFENGFAHWIIPESPKDIFYDLVVGMFGGWVYFLNAKRFSNS